jgi:pSer/pThr/pTyr-binding forkhead associated (FHA) protein
LSELFFVEERPVSGRKEQLTADMTIGRADCDVLLADPDVSRRHAIVREIEGGLGIEDLGSRNGTYLDGERITGVAPLRPGGNLRFGNTVWRIEASTGAARVA